MENQLFKVLAASFITMNMIIKFKMSHVNRNCKCAKIKASRTCNQAV